MEHREVFRASSEGGTYGVRKVVHETHGLRRVHRPELSSVISWVICGKNHFSIELGHARNSKPPSGVLARQHARLIRGGVEDQEARVTVWTKSPEVQLLVACTEALRTRAAVSLVDICRQLVFSIGI